MQNPEWKLQALAALERQEQTELHSGYDIRESLIAVDTMQQWVTQNTCENQTEFLQQLDDYYQHIRQNWAFPGEYNGGTATLGTCHSLIRQAVLNEANNYRIVPPRQYHRTTLDSASSQNSSPQSPERNWFKRHYPHWFLGWRECLKVEIKSFALGLIYTSAIFLVIYVFFY